jgi:hypothetical protein
MCFSASASFISAGIIGGIGAAALLRTRPGRDVPVASLPLLFAVHQGLEGVVWLSIHHGDPTLRSWAAHVYLVFAWGLVPALVPAAIALVEPIRWRRILLWAAAALGAAVGTWLLIEAFQTSIDVHVQQHRVVYEYHGPARTALIVAYVAVSNAAPLVSSRRWLRGFALALSLGLAISAITSLHAFISVWCAFAAVASSLIYLHVIHLERLRLGTEP